MQGAYVVEHQGGRTPAGVAPRLIHGDVTRLDDLGVEDGYTLLLDFWCRHTLPSDRRLANVTSVSRGAAPGATLQMFGFRRRGVAPVHAGMTVEILQRFTSAGWELVNAERTSVEEIAERRVGAGRRSFRIVVLPAAAHLELTGVHTSRKSAD